MKDADSKQWESGLHSLASRSSMVVLLAEIDVTRCRGYEWHSRANVASYRHGIRTHALI